jgi:hypothetical protein
MLRESIRYFIDFFLEIVQELSRKFDIAERGFLSKLRVRGLV